MKSYYCFLIGLLLTACFNSEIKNEFYENGQLKEAASYKGDQLEGEYKAYYENGQIRAEGVYEGGKMIGTWKYWYDHGTQMSEGTYEENKLVKLQAWDKDGIQTIKDCTGTTFLYYSDGTTMSQVSYKDCLTQLENNAPKKRGI